MKDMNHPPCQREQRIINQPYVPENIIVSPSTNIVWLNGDVGHTHLHYLSQCKISRIRYSDGKIQSQYVTDPLVLNKTGKFTYSEGDVNQHDPKFVMQGTITVNENPPSNSSIPLDTVAFFMIPAKDLDKHVRFDEQGYRCS